MRDGFKRQPSVRLPVLVHEGPPAVAPDCGQIEIGIRDLIARTAVANLYVYDIATAAIDQLMPIRLTFGKPGRHARSQDFLAGLGYEGGLAFEHHNELVFERVPMAQR